MHVSNNREPLVSLVIFNWNGKHLISKFLPKVIKEVDPPTEVILLDNGSTDGSVEYVMENYPNVTILREDKNYGTAEGSNIAARYCKGKFILFLGNDQYITRDSIKNMIHIFEQDERVGAITGKTLRVDHEGKPDGKIDQLGFLIDKYGLPYAIAYNHPDSPIFNKPFEVFFCGGSGMMVRRDLFAKFGGFDPLYFVLQEDYDFCWRLKLFGYKTIAQPKALIYHRVSSTTSKFGRAKIRYLSERNMMTTFIKNRTTKYLIKNLPRYLGMLIMEILFFLMSLRPKLAIADMKALIWNLIKFKRNWMLHAALQSKRTAAENDFKHLIVDRNTRIDIFRKLINNQGVWL